MYDICIIGADLLGAFLAHRLSQTTARVLWLEQEPDIASGRSSTLSGYLSYNVDEKNPALTQQVIQKGIALYPDLCQNLSIPFQYTAPPYGGYVDPVTLCFALAEEAVLNQVALHLSTKVSHLAMLQNATSFFHSHCIINTTRQFFADSTPSSPAFIQLPPLTDAGFSAAPAIASHIVETLLPSTFPKKKIFLKRNPPLCLKDMIPIERNHYVHAHPEAGRIVCRCCQITEAEIMDVIRRPVGATDFEGVKKRLGIGTGLCHGSRCHSKIEALLAQEVLCTEKN